MATINATMSLSSDISEYGLSFSKTMQMNKAGSVDGLELTTGLARRSITNTNHVDLLTAGAGIAVDVTASKSAKVYIKNVGTDATTYINVGFGNASTSGTATVNDNDATFFELGRLYGGNWMLIPWIATSTTGDITIQASVATTAAPQNIEYMVFFE
jgi:hypothetical protein